MSDSKQTVNGDSNETRATGGGIVREFVPLDVDIGAEEQPIVRLRNGTTVQNGQQQSNGQAAILRGLDMLAEQEMGQELEEIKKLDVQLDHFNKYLDTFEKKNNELTDRLTNMIKTQKEDRLKRRASFMQREEEYKAQQNSFENQVNNMLSRCAQSRRTSVPVFASSVEDQLEQIRRNRHNTDVTSSNKDDRMDTSK